MPELLRGVGHKQLGAQAALSALGRLGLNLDGGQQIGVQARVFFGGWARIGEDVILRRGSREIVGVEFVG